MIFINLNKILKNEVRNFKELKYEGEVNPVWSCE